MAELHCIGQLVGATDFPEKNLFCIWEFQAGGGWSLVEGDRHGQTQTDEPLLDDMSVWNHPLDVHYATKGLPGWPKLHLQVWHQDAYGRCEIYGYGFVTIPTTPGRHRIECRTWKPQSSLRDQFVSYFLGGGAQLRSTDVVYSQADRFRLYTTSSGSVVLDLQLVLRNFDKFGVEYC